MSAKEITPESGAVLSSEDEEMYEIYREELPKILKKIEELEAQVKFASRHDQATAIALGAEIKALKAIRDQYSEAIKRVEETRAKRK